MKCKKPQTTRYDSEVSLQLCYYDKRDKIWHSCPEVKTIEECNSQRDAIRNQGHKRFKLVKGVYTVYIF